MTCAKSNNSCIIALTPVYLCWKRARNTTSDEWWISFICARQAAYLCWIFFPK